MSNVLRSLVQNGDGSHGLIKELFTWLFRVGLLAGVFWIKANFVPIEKYESNKEDNTKELHAISNNVQKITDKLESAPDLSSYDQRIKALDKEVERLREKSK